MIPAAGTPERLRYTYWYILSFGVVITGRLHYSESNIMMLNIMALVFGRMPEQAPFFIKPLLRAISKKAEQGDYTTLKCKLMSSILWTAIEDEYGVYGK